MNVIQSTIAKSIIVLVIIMAFVICMLTSCVGSKSYAVNKYFYNPVNVAEEMGDPWMLFHDGYYYYTHSDGVSVTITRTKHITDVQQQTINSKQVFFGELNGLTQIWAPEIYFVDGHFYAYFAADTDNNNILHRMYSIKSKTDDPFGEWELMGKLNLPADQWAIDGTLLETDDGKLYTIWAGWKDVSEGARQYKQYLYIAECEGRDPTKIKSEQRVLISTPTLLWETGDLPQNEGPAILKSPKGTVYCVYSANFSGKDNYALGYLQLNGDPMKSESWKKSPEPLASTLNEDDNVISPGHCSFVKSPDGKEDWIIYHATKASGAEWDRSARVQKIDWIDDRPVFIPKPLCEKIALPSGEKVKRTGFEIEKGKLSQSAKITEYKNASGQKAVTFTDSDASSTIVINVKKEGSYSFVMRHNNPSGRSSNFNVQVNDGGPMQVFAGRTVDDREFSTAGFTIPLEKGKNTLVFTSFSDVELDLLIMNNEPIIIE